MEDLAKKVSQKYIDEITLKYPLHRFICLYLYLFSFYVFYTKGDSRLLSSTHEIKIDFLFDFSDGLLAQASIFHLSAAIITTFATARISTILKKVCFNLISSLSSFEEYLSKLKYSITSSKSNDTAANYTMTSDISRQLDIKRSTLRGKQAISEITLTLIICILIGIKGMIYVDWILTLCGVITILATQWEAFKVYLSEFLPFYVAEQILLGNDVSFTQANNDPHE